MLHQAILLITGLIALEHVYILVLEMFLWTKPRGLKTFGLTPDFAKASAGLAKNQGLYNGFLAAGLIWSLVHPDAHVAYELRLFFLGCVFIAGVYGGFTVKPKIFWIQGLPALVTLALVAVKMIPGSVR